jgi:hypothetical protein
MVAFPFKTWIRERGRDRRIIHNTFFERENPLKGLHHDFLRKIKKDYSQKY